MAISLVNFAGGGQQGGPYTTTVSPAQNVTSGNSIIVGIRWSAAFFTDNAGNTYTPLPHLVGNPVSNLGEGFQFAYCNNVVGNPNLQVTATMVPTSQALDTYTAIAVWQIAGGTLILDSNLIATGSGSTQTFSNTTRYPNSITCLMDIGTSNLANYGANSPLTLDGGTSLGGQQICGASHIINTTLQSAQSLSMTTSISGTWQLGGPTFGLVPQIPPRYKHKAAIAAAPPMFTGRMYAYYITLERLF